MEGFAMALTILGAAGLVKGFMCVLDMLEGRG